MTPEIKIDLYPSPAQPGKFAAAVRRMARSIAVSYGQQAAVRAFNEAAEGMAQQPRPAPWWLRWLPPVRRWWDRRELVAAEQRRAEHMVAAAIWQRAVDAASVAVAWADGDGEARR
jgi:hypothetical protein